LARFCFLIWLFSFSTLLILKGDVLKDFFYHKEHEVYTKGHKDNLLFNKTLCAFVKILSAALLSSLSQSYSSMGMVLQANKFDGKPLERSAIRYKCQFVEIDFIKKKCSFLEVHFQKTTLIETFGSVFPKSILSLPKKYYNDKKR
jgi:hypothetical protein